jgi:hypothetical protein
LSGAPSLARGGFVARSTGPTRKGEEIFNLGRGCITKPTAPPGDTKSRLLVCEPVRKDWREGAAASP